MFETLMGTALVYGVLVWAPGMLASGHPKAGPEFLRAWSLASVVLWLPFAVLWVVGWSSAASFWALGSVTVTVVLVANALLARQHRREQLARDARVLARFDRGMF